MRVKRLVPAIIAGFIFVFAYEWLLHGILLRSIYETTPQVWRAKAEMSQFLPYLFGGQLLMTIFLGLIFAKGYENRGYSEGIRYGMLMGFFISSMHLTGYAIQPVSATLALCWILGSIVEMIGLGIIFAAICRPKES